MLSLPSAPDFFTATAGDGRVRLVWGNPTYVGVIDLSDVQYQYRYAPGAHGARRHGLEQRTTVFANFGE